MLTTFENSKPEISCIYVNYHSAALLEQSITSLLQHERSAPFEIIVVNNDESEKEAISILGEKYPLTIIESFHNPGFGAACNQGAKQAKTPILFFVNPDTRWHQSFFSDIQECFRENQHLGAVGIQLVSPEGVKEEHNAGPLFTLKQSLLSSKGPRKVEWLSGGALFVLQEAFQAVKGFDEQFFMYFEDMDLGLRLKKAGYELKLYTDQTLIHLGGQSYKSKKTQKTAYDRSLYTYTKKHWPRWQYVFFRIAHPLYRFFFPYGR